MGEQVYRIGKTEIRFDEGDDSYVCLCTFPYNDNGKLDADRVRSLALLGAAVRIAVDMNGSEVMFLPHAVPEWIRKEIDRVIWGKQ